PDEDTARVDIITGGLTLPGAASDKGAPDELAQTPFLRGSGGDGRAVLHSDILDDRLRRPLLDAGPLRDEASAAPGESGHDVDGRVWRVQLRPASLRRLPRRPLPFEPELIRRGHGVAGDRLRLHRDRHAGAVLRWSCPFPHW